MDRLKKDVFEELIRDKNFIEIDNVRLSQNPVISYRDAVNQIKENLEKIAIINGTIGLLEVYFPEPKEETPDQPAVQQPMVEEPVVQEPVVQEPVVKEAPVTEKAPVAIEKVEAVEEIVTDSPFPKITK